MSFGVVTIVTMKIVFLQVHLILMAFDRLKLLLLVGCRNTLHLCFDKLLYLPNLG